MTAVRERAQSAEHRAPRRNRDRRKVLAIASAFSVLGVGAGITTLASWTQSFTVGTTNVGTSTLCVKESLDGSNWLDQAATSAGTAVFTVASGTTGVTTLSPGDLLYAPVEFAACAGSRPATISLTSVALTGSAAISPYLNYVVFSAASPAACAAGTVGSALTSSTGSAFSATPATSSIATLTNTGATSAVTTTAGSTQVYAGQTLCMQLKVSTGLPATSADMGQTATPSWTFNVTSS